MLAVVKHVTYIHITDILSIVEDKLEDYPTSVSCIEP